METLTRRQREIYDFIVDRVGARNLPPSLTEIATAFGLASPSGVAEHLKALERKGYIRRRRGIPRGIELLRRGRGGATVRLPIVGSVPSPGALLSVEQVRRYLYLDGRIAAGATLAVRAELDGLEERGILPGDYLVVGQGTVPGRGDLAVVSWPRGTALVELRSRSGRPRRVDTWKEIDEGFELVGRVVAVLRSMREGRDGD